MAHGFQLPQELQPIDPALVSLAWEVLNGLTRYDGGFRADMKSAKQIGLAKHARRNKNGTCATNGHSGKLRVEG